MSLAGTRWLIFEARRAEQTATLFRRAGAEPATAAVLREEPVDRESVLAFAQRVERAECDILIAETGVGVRILWNALSAQLGQDAARSLLERPLRVSRSSKPAAAFREIGVPPGVLVPEPNTWREILSTLAPLPGKLVSVLEYGKPDPQLLDGLAAQGRVVDRVSVYRYALPDDLGPLESELRQLIEGQFDGAAFTSSAQVDHVLEAAQRLGLIKEVRRALGEVVIASIGPTTSETLRRAGLPPAFEPSVPKLGIFVRELSGFFSQRTRRRSGRSRPAG